MGIQQTNFRLDEADAQKFREFCNENGWNQAQGFAAILEMAELSKLRDANPARATELDDFATHIQQILKAFNHSIELNSNAEARIRVEFEKQLDSQLDTIADLRAKDKLREEEKKEALEKASQMMNEAKSVVDELTTEKNNLLSQINEMNIELEKAKESVENNVEILNVYKEKASSYEEDAKKYITAVSEIKELSNKVAALEKMNSDLIKDHALEINKIELASEKEKRKFEEAIKKDFDEEIEDLEEKYEKQIHELKDDHKEEIKSLKDEIKELRSLLYKKESK